MTPEEIAAMAEAAATKAVEAYVAAQAASTAATPIPNTAPAAPPTDDPLEQVKQMLQNMEQNSQSQAMGEIFNMQKQQVFDATPGFQKFLEEGTDPMGKAFLPQFDQEPDIKKKAEMLKNLQSTYMQASVPATTAPAGTEERTPAEEAASKPFDDARKQFQKGESTVAEFRDAHWAAFDKAIGL